MSEPEQEPGEVKTPSAWDGPERRSVKRWAPTVRTDDPEARQVHGPLASGIGDGKAFFFMFGFRLASEADRAMRERELAKIDNDVEVLRRSGFTVVIDEQATRQDFLDMIQARGEGAEGLPPVGVYWSAHGHPDGAVDCCDGDRVRPSDLDAIEVSPDLRIVVFGACYVGSRARSWRTALGGVPLVVGWGRPLTIDRAVDFLEPDPETETDLDDLLRRFILRDAPLPGEPDGRHSPLAPAAMSGRAGDLGERMDAVAEMLAAAWREGEGCLEVMVPLEGNRRHGAKVFVVDSAEPFAEGDPMLGVEADVGELTPVVDLQVALAGLPAASYARVALVESDTESPNIVTQGFLPLSRVRNQDLAALIHHVAWWADVLERRIFGGDMR